METSFFTSLPKSSHSTIAFPFFLSHKSSNFLVNRTSPNNSNLCFTLKSSGCCSFLGQTLNFERDRFNLRNDRRIRFRDLSIRAAVKRRKELTFDNVIQRDKKLKMAMKIRKILLSYPDRIMPLRELGKYRRALGLEKKRRFIALLKKFPGVFEIVEEGVYSLRFRMTPEAERLYLEELKLRNEMEELHVVKLRKLLMISLDKRILLEKIAHLMNDFGLPVEFRNTICHRYPQYFKVVPTERGPALELTHWDPELAVSAAELAEEEKRIQEAEEKNLIFDRPPKFKVVQLPKGLKLSKNEMRRISQFRDLPYVSPYSDFSDLRQGTPEKEKHACGVVHEILSLTVEKRTLVDHLTHFREEFRFSQQLRGMLIRHPDMFYVSLKGDRDSVFLRDAYRDSQLVDKDKMLIIKEKMRALVAIAPVRGARMSNVNGTKGTGGESDEGSEEDGEDWSDIDNILDDDDDDDDDGGEEYEDDWSEEDDVPPDFDDDDGDSVKLGSRRKPARKLEDVIKNVEEDLIPAFPDGRPREIW